MGCSIHAFVFLFVGICKVYKDNIKNLDDLREKITTTIISIKTDVLNRVFSEISKRLVLVIDKNGRHVEQLN